MLGTFQVDYSFQLLQDNAEDSAFREPTGKLHDGPIKGVFEV